MLPKIRTLEKPFAICKVSELTAEIFRGNNVFVAKTPKEISIVSEEDNVPQNATETSLGWRGFAIVGQLDFSLVGILCGITSVLAENRIPVFAVSTFDTDYFFVKSENFNKTVTALKNVGYRLCLQYKSMAFHP